MIHHFCHVTHRLVCCVTRFFCHITRFFCHVTRLFSSYSKRRSTAPPSTAPTSTASSSLLDSRDTPVHARNTPELATCTTAPPRVPRLPLAGLPLSAWQQLDQPWIKGVGVYVYVYIHTYVCLCVRVCACVCVCVCVFVCVYLCVRLLRGYLFLPGSSLISLGLRA